MMQHQMNCIQANQKKKMNCIQVLSSNNIKESISNYTKYNYLLMLHIIFKFKGKLHFPFNYVTLQYILLKHINCVFPLLTRLVSLTMNLISRIHHSYENSECVINVLLRVFSLNYKNKHCPHLTIGNRKSVYYQY